MPSTAALPKHDSEKGVRPLFAGGRDQAARPRANVDYRACLIRNLTLIKDVVRAVGRRYRVSADEEADLLGATFLKLVDEDYAVLRRFRGESLLKTFLYAVVHRVLLDRRNSAWGKWRPSSRARRLGAAAIRLEELIVRDRLTPGEAIELVASDRRWALSADELAAIHAKLPPRVRRARVRVEAIEAIGLRAAQTADAAIECEARQRDATHVREALTTALASLGPDERHILRMRFQDSWSIAEIARATGADQKALYRRFDAILARLRTRLERERVTRLDVAPLLGDAQIDLENILDPWRAAANVANL